MMLNFAGVEGIAGLVREAEILLTVTIGYLSPLQSPYFSPNLIAVSPESAIAFSRIRTDLPSIRSPKALVSEYCRGGFSKS